MPLKDLINLDADQRKVGLSPERVEAIIPVARQYISFWRDYPDLFVDFLQDGGNPEVDRKLKFYFYQRVFLRAAMRHKYVYMVFPRAYSKSFLSILTLMCRCILYPKAKLFVTSGGKEQAAGIVREKVEELCSLVPAFNDEIDRSPRKTSESKDYVQYVFKNGSYFDNIAASEKSRGKRRHGGLVEESASVDGTILSEVIIPTMNVSRPCMDGSTHPEETLNKSQIFVTTAGWKNTFAYDKLIQFLVWSVTEPDKAIIMGGTWRIPVLVKLLDRGFISDLKRDGTFNEASFAREYESKWSGTVADAFFNGEIFDRNRVLNAAEKEASGRAGAQSYYVLGVDVGRKGCASVVCVFKVNPQAVGAAIKSLVNIYTFEDMHFQDQAIMLKKLFYAYKAKKIALDGNGLGIGLIDEMVKSNTDEKTGITYPDFGVDNDEENYYKKYRTPVTELDAMYIIKAKAGFNSEAHVNAQSQLSSGKVKMLIDERTAKAKLLGSKVGQNMTPEERAEYLKPYKLTDILKEEMMNLREEHTGANNNVVLKQENKSVPKDKFSAFEYGLYYIKQEEDKGNKRHSRNFKDFVFMN